MNLKLVALALIAVLGTVAVVYAATQLTSNSVVITPQPTPTPATLTLTANTTSPFIGEKVQLTVVLSSHQVGIAVDFKMNGTTTQTVATNSEGVAIFTTPATTIDTWVYTATCTI